MFKVIVQECKMSTESKTERTNGAVNGCKLIAVMWTLIPINQGQCGLLCHLCVVGKGGGGLQIYMYICNSVEIYSHNVI